MRGYAPIRSRTRKAFGVSDIAPPKSYPGSRSSKNRGWMPRLLRTRPSVRPPALVPIMDTDLGVEETMPMQRSRMTIEES